MTDGEDDVARYPSTVGAPVEHELVVKKSRFVTTVAPVRSIAEADGVVAAVRRRYWDAGHHCLALVVGLHGEQQRSSDSGEPSGTAGVPMLEVLRRRELTDLVAVVSRYFGGTKLGAGGLVRAYSGAVSETLDRARIVRRTAAARVVVTVPHADAGRIEAVLRDWAEARGARVQDVGYAEQVRIVLLVPPNRLADLDSALAAASGGRLAGERDGTVISEG